MPQIWKLPPEIIGRLHALGTGMELADLGERFTERYGIGMRSLLDARDSGERDTKLYLVLRYWHQHETRRERK